MRPEEMRAAPSRDAALAHFFYGSTRIGGLYAHVQSLRQFMPANSSYEVENGAVYCQLTSHPMPAAHSTPAYSAMTLQCPRSQHGIHGVSLQHWSCATHPFELQPRIVW